MMRAIQRQTLLGLGGVCLIVLLGACGGTNLSQSGLSSTTSHSTTTIAASGSGKATVHVTQPYTADYTGGTCSVNGTGYKGDLLFTLGAGSQKTANFVFILGPDPNSLGDVGGNNPAYHGPDTYTNVTISGYDPVNASQTFFDVGSVTLNADVQTGSFHLDNQSAAGTFDCGVLQPKT